MHTVTLLTNPAVRMDVAAAEALRNAWGGGDLRWLAPDLACDFTIAKVPRNLWEVWAEFQNMGVDLVVQAGMPKVARLLIADMDSTMIGQECIDELAAEAGVLEEVAAITRRAMNGELAFEESVQARVALLEGLNTDVIARVLSERITHTPGGAVMVATMKAQGAHTALVSGGFTAFTTVVAGDLGFNEHRANTLIEEAGILTGKVGMPILGRAAKVEAMDEMTARLEIGRDAVLTVGDGANDLDMLGAAGLGVALHAKPAVQEACSARINHGDLTALLYLQGLSVDQFAKL